MPPKKGAPKGKAAKMPDLFEKYNEMMKAPYIFCHVNVTEKDGKFSANGVVNDTPVAVSDCPNEEAAKQAYAKTFFETFGAAANFTSSPAAFNSACEQVGFRLMTWSPRHLLKWFGANHIRFQLVSCIEGVYKVSCKYDDEEWTHEGNDVHATNAQVALNVLRSDEVKDKYCEWVARGKTHRERRPENNQDNRKILKAGDGPNVQKLAKMAAELGFGTTEFSRWEKPEGEEEDKPAKVRCKITMECRAPTREEACTAIMEKIHAAQAQIRPVEQAKPSPAKKQKIKKEKNSNVNWEMTYDADSIAKSFGNALDGIEFPILAVGEHCKKEGMGKPTFFDHGEIEEGGDKKLFKACCKVGEQMSFAQASSKKQAKQLAAQVMIMQLRGGEGETNGAPANGATNGFVSFETADTKTPHYGGAVSNTPPAPAKLPAINPNPTTSVSYVNEMAQLLGLNADFQTDGGTPNGPNNKKSFKTTLTIGGLTSYGDAANKKESKQSAAENIMAALHEKHGTLEACRKAKMDANPEKAQKRRGSFRGRGRGGKQAKTEG